MYCKYCFNARVCDDDDDIVLTDDNDLSFCSIGETVDGLHRMMLRAGSGQPVSILSEEWSDSFGWSVVAKYQPKYCPECGRRLNEYDND